MSKRELQPTTITILQSKQGNPRTAHLVVEHAKNNYNYIIRFFHTEHAIVLQERNEFKKRKEFLDNVNTLIKITSVYDINLSKNLMSKFASVLYYINKKAIESDSDMINSVLITLRYFLYKEIDIVADFKTLNKTFNKYSNTNKSI